MIESHIACPNVEKIMSGVVTHLFLSSLIYAGKAASSADRQQAGRQQQCQGGAGDALPVDHYGSAADQLVPVSVLIPSTEEARAQRAVPNQAP